MAAGLTIHMGNGSFGRHANNLSIIRYNGVNRCDSFCMQDRTNEYYRNIRRQNEINLNKDDANIRSYRQGYRDGYHDSRRSARNRNHRREWREGD